MSAKLRFLQKLQSRQPGSGAFENKGQADIAEFRQRMSELQEQTEGWLTGTGVQTESVPVSLVEFLISSTAFNVSGLLLRYEARSMKIHPDFFVRPGCHRVCGRDPLR